MHIWEDWYSQAAKRRVGEVVNSGQQVVWHVQDDGRGAGYVGQSCQLVSLQLHDVYWRELLKEILGYVLRVTIVERPVGRWKRETNGSNL